MLKSTLDLILRDLKIRNIFSRFNITFLCLHNKAYKGASQDFRNIS